jgi:hypothetical protein
MSKQINFPLYNRIKSSHYEFVLQTDIVEVYEYELYLGENKPDPKVEHWSKISVLELQLNKARQFYRTLLKDGYTVTSRV